MVEISYKGLDFEFDAEVYHVLVHLHFRFLFTFFFIDEEGDAARVDIPVSYFPKEEIEAILDLMLRYIPIKAKERAYLKKKAIKILMEDKRGLFGLYKGKT